MELEKDNWEDTASLQWQHIRRQNWKCQLPQWIHFFWRRVDIHFKRRRWGSRERAGNHQTFLPEIHNNLVRIKWLYLNLDDQRINYSFVRTSSSWITTIPLKRSPEIEAQSNQLISTQSQIKRAKTFSSKQKAHANRNADETLHKTMNYFIQI